MKIIQVIPHLGSGGAERFVVDLCNELSSRGNDITLCTFYDLKGSLGFYKNEISHDVKVVSFGKSGGFSFLFLFKFIKLIKSEKPDILHTHINSLQYTFIAQLLYSHGVHTVHNEAHLESKGLLGQILRKLLFKYHWIQPVTISPESQQSFYNFYGIDAPLINNGRTIESINVSENVKNEIESYKKDNTTRVLIQLARFQPQKNIPMMARVASRLYIEGYNFTLLFIGSTENQDVLKSVSSIMPPCAHILGEKNNPLEYLKCADGFTLSSLYEGLPISLIEALGVGCVPICTPVGGIPNAVIDGYNGFLSTTTSEQSYYEALKKFLNVEDCILSGMKENALLSFKQYGMKTCASKYIELYQQLLR